MFSSGGKVCDGHRRLKIVRTTTMFSSGGKSVTDLGDLK